jgi:hypothetical protein
VLGLAAAVVSPAEARTVESQGSDLTVELARAVTGQKNVYAPTGETVDSTVVVTASRL